MAETDSQVEELTQNWRKSPFLNEAKAIIKLASPQVASSTLDYLVQIIPVIFVGRLGTLQLASVSLATALINQVSYACARGCVTAADTFISQTFGTSNKFKVGEHLQRCIVMSTLVQCICIAILVNASPLLVLLKQPPDAIYLCQYFLDWRLWGLPVYLWYFTLSRYIQNQQVILPNLLISFLGCLTSAGLNYLLVWHLQYGVWGAALAINLTYVLMLVGIMGYIRCSKMYIQTWNGWTSDCLHEWGCFGKLAFSSTLLVSLTWFSLEYGSFVAGALGELELAVQSVMFQIEGLTFMVSFGLGCACQTRIGIKLGHRDPAGAIRTFKAAMTVQGGLVVVVAAIVYICGKYIMMLFSKDAAAIEMGEGVMPLVCTFLLFELFFGVVFGVFRGIGRQFAGAMTSLIGLVVVGMTTSVCLALLTKLRMTGIWIGYDVGYGLQLVIFVAYIKRVNWQKESKKAQVRAGITRPEDTRMEALTGNTNSETTEIDTEIQEEPKRTILTKAQLLCRRSLLVLCIILIMVAAIVFRTFTNFTDRSSRLLSLQIMNHTVPYVVATTKYGL